MIKNKIISDLFGFLGVIWTVDVKEQKLIYRCTKHKPSEEEKIIIQDAFKKLGYKSKNITYVERI